MTELEKIKSLLEKLGLCEVYEHNYRRLHGYRPWAALIDVYGDTLTLEKFLFEFNMSQMSFYWAGTDEGFAYWEAVCCMLKNYMGDGVKMANRLILLAKKLNMYNGLLAYLKNNKVCRVNSIPFEVTIQAEILDVFRRKIGGDYKSLSLSGMVYGFSDKMLLDGAISWGQCMKLEKYGHLCLYMNA